MTALVDRLIYGAVRSGSVVPFEVLASLALPLCEIEFGGESHYLMKIERRSNDKVIYITACGGELPEQPSPSDEPICKECKGVVGSWGYEVD